MMGKGSRKMHIAMFPWFAFGHIIPYLHLSNELAGRGHTITFFLPRRALSKLQPLINSNLISFSPLVVPNVDGLPLGAETASDTPFSVSHLLATAFDRTSDQVEAALRALRPRPDFLLFDLACWAPDLASRLGIKSVYYSIVCAATVAYIPIPNIPDDDHEAVQVQQRAAAPPLPPPGYPSSTVVLRPHELPSMDFVFAAYPDGITFQHRITTALSRCDAISFRTCQEIEGPLCDYIGSQYRKPVFLTGPVLPKPPSQSEAMDQDRYWANWLGGFTPGSVIYCAFGSQSFMKMEQFQELVLGLELTGLPFLVVALRPPTGAATVEEALPEGFKERVGGRGVVHEGWVPQTSILNHPSVGCFVSHCGCGSMWESLTSHPQIVLLPEITDQILNTRLLVEELKVAVEVEKEEEENGWFSKQSLCKAIKTVLMDGDSEVGGVVKKNHAEWKETLTGHGFMTNYIDNFVQQLQQLLMDH